MRLQGYVNLGWTPILAVVNDGARRVLQVTGWTGGTGTAPATGLYVSATGYDANIANGVDIRGSGTTWGGITGTLASQADLQAALTEKQNKFIFLATDYGVVADGTTVANSAINSLFSAVTSAGGGVVYFPTGTIKIDDTTASSGEVDVVFSIPANTEIRANGTTFTATGSIGFSFHFDNNYIRWIGNTILNKGRVSITASNIYIEGIRNNYSLYHSFHLSGGKPTDDVPTSQLTYSNITLVNCYAYRSARHSFSMHRGTGNFSGHITYMGNFKNIKFIGCTGEQPSYIDGSTFNSTYDYNFGIEFVISAHDVTYMDCVGTLGPSAGWHTETLPVESNIVLINCRSDNNGQYSGSTTYPFGYMYKSGWTFINCTGTGNSGALFHQDASFDGGDTQFINCGEIGYEKSTLGKDKMSDGYIFYPGRKETFACGKCYPGGSTTYLLMKSLPRTIFTTGSESVSITESGTGLSSTRTVPYIYSTVASNNGGERDDTIACRPVLVDVTKQYKIRLTAKQLSGATGTIYIYVQEFDKDYQLILRGSQRYMLKRSISEITTSWTTYEMVIGASSIFPSGAVSTYSDSTFYQKTKWLRVSVVFSDDSSYDKTYAVSEFSVLPQVVPTSSSSGITRSVNVISTNTAAGSTANTDYVYLVSGSTTVTLPTAVSNTNEYTIKRVGSSNVTIATTSSQTIDGSSTAVITVQYTSLTLVSDGANWNLK